MIVRRSVVWSVAGLAALGAATGASCGGDPFSPEQTGGAASTGIGAGSSTSPSSSSAGGGGTGGGCVAQPESCDGIDNDCDGEIDEGCSCDPGSHQDCYGGPAGTQDVGECKNGQQTCGDLGTWGPCTGDVQPATETCNGKDDDCDGTEDDGLPDVTCGVGACENTVPSCKEGNPQACVPHEPGTEVCNGEDDDCDGQTDEGNPGGGAACSTGLPGVCGPGTMLCQGGSLTCVQNVQAGAEVCNVLDDDCDGQTDEGNPGGGAACNTGGIGACAQGTITCQGGMLGCVQNQPPTSEICNGIDDNCDGATDEGNPGGGGACNTGIPGPCAAGISQCEGGALKCKQTVLPAAEICNNGVDDNCDGTADGAVATTYFLETFAGNTAGWLLDTEWQIGPAAISSGQTFGNPDPATDTTSTLDNGVAGVVIGGNASTTIHPYRYLTSPAVNTTAAQALVLEFQRSLNSDYAPYMDNAIEAWNGAAWVKIWTSGGMPGITDVAWKKIALDLTPYKGAGTKVRFGVTVGQAGTFVVASWSIDDVRFTSCTVGP